MRWIAFLFFAGTLFSAPAPVRASVITTGDVDPGGAAVQPDPWGVSGGRLKVGHHGVGTLSITEGGWVSTNNSFIGSAPDSSGTATVTGDGSKWRAWVNLMIGSDGTGILNVDNGGLVENNDGFIGHDANPFGWDPWESIGTVTVTGVGSTWYNARYLYIGRKGTGTLVVDSGGRVDSSQGDVGFESHSEGTVTVTGAGSIWVNNESPSDIQFYFYDSGAVETGDLSVGVSGTGTVNIENGGRVENNKRAYLGANHDGNGTVTVTDSGSSWVNDDLLIVGHSGTGALHVNNGGLVENSTGSIGSQANSNGTATVTGSGSSWVNEFDIFVGYSGTGTLHVEDGGSVSSTHGYLGYNVGASGTATVTGADSSWTTSFDLEIGGHAGGTAEVSVLDGGTLLVGRATRINSGSTLTLSGAASRLELGGSFTNAGTFDWQSGTVDLQSGSSWSPAGDLDLTGSKTLRLSDSQLSLSGTFTDAGNFDWQSGGVTVTGASASWTNPSTLTVGSSGTGTLRVEDGGSVTTGNYGYVGYNVGSSGTATVTGADSSWDNSSALTVGNYGTGVLSVQSGGSVTDTTGYLGHESGSSGTATVTGAESSWDNTGNLYVGRRGMGTLRVEDGGSVTGTADAYVGRYSGSNGTATITGTGSSLATSTGLYLGGNWSSAGGTAAVSVLDGGTLSVGGETMIHSGSTLTLGTGTFTSSGITMAGGTLAASMAAGEEGGLYSADVGTVSGYGEISAPLHLGASGLVAGSGGVLTLSGGVTGSGTLSDLTLDGGQITIGNSPGVITLEDVLVADNTTFDFSIQDTDPSEYDRILLAGGVTLDGVMNVSFVDGFMPADGSTFQLVDLGTATVTGWFSEVNFPTYAYNAYLDSSGVLTIQTPEPAAILLALFGLALLPRSRRR